MKSPLRDIKIEKTTNGIPFVVIDNFFKNSEKKQILHELEFIRPHLNGPGTTGGAENPDGSTKKYNNSLWCHDFFAAPQISAIYNLTRQYYEPDLLSQISAGFWPAQYFNIFPNFVRQNIQVLYYEQNNNYDTHVDKAFVTCLYWTHKTPKKFEGGDIILDGETNVKCKDNRLLIFPSITKHKVTPVNMINKGNGYGRYCISNFVHLHTIDQ